ncbi:hypothetical protein PENPOL_c002G02566 [Penicillium polonicum]|uniref:Uncharacterized protein n=1 Tax=Penicillium polonicum TaxID=60169 RepID=A0A1V6NXE9_PENPO|nr:hypothetical protein PENPOL_c002G02566 [Penicillium polonicum]
MTSTNDLTVIAKELAECLRGSIPGEGSHWNPQALPSNCVFVSIAFCLGRTAPQLSSISGLEQPPGVRDEEAVLGLLQQLKDRGLVSDFWSSDNKPFQYKCDFMWKTHSHMVVYRRPDGLGKHCVVGTCYERLKLYDYQNSDGGPGDWKFRDVTDEVQGVGAQRGGEILRTILVVPQSSGRASSFRITSTPSATHYSQDRQRRDIDWRDII